MWPVGRAVRSSRTLPTTQICVRRKALLVAAVVTECTRMLDLYCATQNDHCVARDLHRKWGSAIKSARQAKGWTQTALADQLKVRPSTVCRWEAGGCAPSDANKLRIASVLDADVRELFRLVETA